MQEIWKDVVQYEGYYLVSNLGRVKSLGAGKNNKIAILTANANPQGYLRVNLWKDRKYKTFSVHRLVAQAFIVNPDAKRTINHINGVKTDNNVSNLEWNTHSENHIHAFHVLGRKPNIMIGADHPRSRPVKQMDVNGNVIGYFDNQSIAAKMTGVKACKISMVCLGQRRSTGGFKWAFA